MVIAKLWCFRFWRNATTTSVWLQSLKRCLDYFHQKKLPSQKKGICTYTMFFLNRKPTGILFLFFPNPEMGHLNKLDLFFCCLLSTMVKHHQTTIWENIPYYYSTHLFQQIPDKNLNQQNSLEKNREKKTPKIWATTTTPQLFVPRNAENSSLQQDMIPTLEPRLVGGRHRAVFSHAMGGGARLRRHVDQLTEGMGWGVDFWGERMDGAQSESEKSLKFLVPWIWGPKQKIPKIPQITGWNNPFDWRGPIAESLGWFLFCLDVVCCENHIFSNSCWV